MIVATSVLLHCDISSTIDIGDKEWIVLFEVVEKYVATYFFMSRHYLNGDE